MGADPSDPQSWNAYSYVENNPLTRTDPDGLAPTCKPNGDNCSEYQLSQIFVGQAPDCKGEAPGDICVETSQPYQTTGIDTFLYHVLQFAKDATLIGTSPMWAPSAMVANVIRGGPPSPTCVGTWAASGATGGAILGSAGLELGGVGEFVTVPGGGAGGAALGTAGGMILCSAADAGGSGGGNGGRGSKNAGKTVRQILQGKKGSIKNAPLSPGSSSWESILNETWEQVESKARAGEPGYATIRKLLTDSRFDK